MMGHVWYIDPTYQEWLQIYGTCRNVGQYASHHGSIKMVSPPRKEVVFWESPPYLTKNMSSTWTILSFMAIPVRYYIAIYFATYIFHNHVYISCISMYIFHSNDRYYIAI